MQLRYLLTSILALVQVTLTLPQTVTATVETSNTESEVCLYETLAKDMLDFLDSKLGKVERSVELVTSVSKLALDAAVGHSGSMFERSPVCVEKEGSMLTLAHTLRK